MPKFTQKALAFPLAGIGRRAGYRDQTRPYSASWAMNVLGKDVLEGRLRGGSRPALVKVSPVQVGGASLTPITVLASLRYVTLANILQEEILALRNADIAAVTETEELEVVTSIQTAAGVDILTETGQQILVGEELSDYSFMDVAAHNGVLLIADAILKKYTPTTGVVETLAIPNDGRQRGTIPTGCPLICSYRGRVILSGTDHVWYASRQGDMLDWNFSADINDPGRAVAGQLEHAGKIGDKVTAMIPFGDTALLFATANGIWLLRGDPVTGSMSQISEEVGVIAPHGWAQAPNGLTAFLSNKGIYVMAGPNDAPKAFSEDRAGDISSLFRVYPDENIIIMAYDHINEGFMLFITPEDSDTGSVHWWIDVENKALWPFYLQREHCPTAVTRMLFTSIDGYTYGSKETILGCLDRYLRMFSASAADDDGVPVSSHVLLGPIRLAADDTAAGLLNELHGIMGDGSGDVTWRVCVADTAEEAADKGKAGIEAVLAGAAVTGVAASGTWSENHNRVQRPRVRGSWAVVWLEASEPWAFDAITMRVEQLGRFR